MHYNNKDGFVLVTVLLIIAILFPVIIAFHSRVQINLLQAANFRDDIKALRMARSGIEGAAGLLKADDPSYDARTDKWAMQFPAVSVGYGILKVKIDDEDGKINLTQLVSTNGVDINADTEKRLRKLIARLGGKPEIVDALIDWIDSDNDVRGSSGAEEEYYKQLGYLPKNGKIDSLDELLLIRGFDKDLMTDKGLKEYITAAPAPDTKVNINTAPVEVLYVLDDDLREGLVDEIAKYRQENDFKNVGDINNVIGITQISGLQGKIPNIFKVSSTVYTVQSSYTIGKITKNAEAVLKRDGKVISTLQWREF